jgi:hypothetical protein
MPQPQEQHHLETQDQIQNHPYLENAYPRLLIVFPPGKEKAYQPFTLSGTHLLRSLEDRLDLNHVFIPDFVFRLSDASPHHSQGQLTLQPIAHPYRVYEYAKGKTQQTIDNRNTESPQHIIPEFSLDMNHKKIAFSFHTSEGGMVLLDLLVRIHPRKSEQGTILVCEIQVASCTYADQALLERTNRLLSGNVQTQEPLQAAHVTTQAQDQTKTEPSVSVSPTEQTNTDAPTPDAQPVPTKENKKYPESLRFPGSRDYPDIAKQYTSAQDLETVADAYRDLSRKSDIDPHDTTPKPDLYAEQPRFIARGPRRRATVNGEEITLQYPHIALYDNPPWLDTIKKLQKFNNQELAENSRPQWLLDLITESLVIKVTTVGMSEEDIRHPVIHRTLEYQRDGKTHYLVFFSVYFENLEKKRKKRDFILDVDSTTHEPHALIDQLQYPDDDPYLPDPHFIENYVPAYMYSSSQEEPKRKAPKELLTTAKLLHESSQAVKASRALVSERLQQAEDDPDIELSTVTNQLVPLLAQELDRLLPAKDITADNFTLKKSDIFLSPQLYPKLDAVFEPVFTMWYKKHWEVLPEVSKKEMFRALGTLAEKNCQLALNIAFRQHLEKIHEQSMIAEEQTREKSAYTDFKALARKAIEEQWFPILTRQLAGEYARSFARMKATYIFSYLLPARDQTDKNAPGSKPAYPEYPPSQEPAINIQAEPGSMWDTLSQQQVVTASPPTSHRKRRAPRPSPPPTSLGNQLIEQ